MRTTAVPIMRVRQRAAAITDVIGIKSHATATITRHTAAGTAIIIIRGIIAARGITTKRGTTATTRLITRRSAAAIILAGIIGTNLSGCTRR